MTENPYKTPREGAHPIAERVRKGKERAWEISAKLLQTEEPGSDLHHLAVQFMALDTTKKAFKDES